MLKICLVDSSKRQFEPIPFHGLLDVKPSFLIIVSRPLLFVSFPKSVEWSLAVSVIRGRVPVLRFGSFKDAILLVCEVCSFERFFASDL